MRLRCFCPRVEILETRTLLSLSNPFLVPGDAGAAPAAGTQYELQISRGADKSLVVWTDNRSSLGDVQLGWTKFAEKNGTMLDVYAARLDADGNLIDSTPIIISQAQHNQKWPQVGWNGENWLVVWTTERENDPYSEDLLAVRVAPNGAVLDQTPMTVFTGGYSFETHSWSVGSDGSNWVVLWTGWHPGLTVRAVTAARVAPDGTVLDAGGKAVRTITQGFFWGADIAFAGDEYLVTWREDLSQYQVKGQRISASLDPIGSLITFGYAGQYDVTKVASNGDQFFVVAAGNSVYSSAHGIRVSHTGQVLDSDWLTLAPSASSVDVTWDGFNWLAAYSKAVTFSDYDLYASRVAPDGTILDPNGFVIDGGNPYQTQAAIAAGINGKAQVVWRQFVTQNDVQEPALSEITTANIDSDYAVGPRSFVDLGAPRQSVPRMATNGDGFVLVFQSEISGESRVLAQRLDATGQLIDAEPIVVATGYARSPSVAWNGAVYMIVWQAPGSGLNKQIMARRMLPDGTFLDATPILVLAGSGPDVAAAGGTFLVTGIYRQTTQIQYVSAQRISGAGDLLGGPLAVGSSFTRNQRVAAFGGRWIVVRQQHSTHDNPASAVYANFVEPDGTAGSGILVSSGRAPHVAVGNGVALITFDNGDNIYGRRMASDGTFTSNNFTISGAPGTQHFSQVAWNGTMYVVTWLDHRNEDFPNQWRGDVYATRVSPNGRILDRPGFAVADSLAPEETPTVVAANGLSIFAYSAFRSEPPFAAMRVTLRTLSGSPGPDEIGLLPTLTDSTLSAMSSMPSQGGEPRRLTATSEEPKKARTSSAVRPVSRLNPSRTREETVSPETSLGLRAIL